MLVEGPEFEIRLFILVTEMEKGPSVYLQIPKELFNSIEPLFSNVRIFAIPSPHIPVFSDGPCQSHSNGTSGF